MRQSINTVFRIAGGMRTPARRPVSSPDKAFIARFGRFFGGRNHFLPRMPFGDGRGRRLLQPLRRASAREMPRLRRAESARERVPLRLRQSDSRAASRRAPVQPAAAVRARPMSALSKTNEPGSAYCCSCGLPLDEPPPRADAAASSYARFKPSRERFGDGGYYESASVGEPAGFGLGRSPS